MSCFLPHSRLASSIPSIAASRLTSTRHRRFPASSNDAQLQTSANVVTSAKEILSSCPTDRYLLVSVPNIHASDIRDASRCKMPNLCRAVSTEKTRGQLSVAEVIGQVSMDELADYIKSKCVEGRPDAGADIRRSELAHLPSVKEAGKRAEVLADQGTHLVLYCWRSL